MTRKVTVNLEDEEYNLLEEYSKVTDINDIKQTIRSCILTSIYYSKGLPYRVINKREYVVKNNNGTRYKYVLVPRDYTGVILKEADDKRIFTEEENNYLLIPHPSPSDHDKDVTKQIKKMIRNTINNDESIDLYLFKNGRKEIEND